MTCALSYHVRASMESWILNTFDKIWRFLWLLCTMQQLGSLLSADPFDTLSPTDPGTISRIIPSKSDFFFSTAFSTCCQQDKKRPEKINLLTRNKHFHEIFFNYAVEFWLKHFFLMPRFCCVLLNSHLMEKDSRMWSLEDLQPKVFSRIHFFWPPHIKNMATKR